MSLSRTIEPFIDPWCFKGKIIILYGARQVGKTTLSRKIISKFDHEAKLIDCDLASNIAALQTQEPNLLSQFIGNYKLVVIDEAQRVRNIGVNLKILHQYHPNTQIIATGSSSFDLANEINEPLTGRAIEFKLYPFSIEELAQKYDTTELNRRLENILRFGLYPSVFDKDEGIAREELNALANNYLYKDILSFDGIRKSDIVFKILQLLALQVGSEVSATEIGQKLGISHLTVQKYIDLLEKTFVIFRLRALKRNLRNEVANPFKVYFWDLGIRNSLINNFNPLSLRNDAGALWENFGIAERLKLLSNHRKPVNAYFWRTVDQKEIDYIEEANGVLTAYEFKWNHTKSNIKHQSLFVNTYPNSQVNVVDHHNWFTMLMAQLENKPQ